MTTVVWGFKVVKLFLLGLGGWASNPFMNHTSLLLVSERNRILIDVGECTYSSLRMCTPYDVNDLDYVVVTHRHGDHLLGLPTMLIHAKRLGTRIRVVGLKDVYEAINELLRSIGIPGYSSIMEFRAIEDGSKLRLGDATLTAISAIHPVPALMLRFDIDGKCIAYSGDSSPNANFIDLIRGCGALIHEASADNEFREDALKYGHSTVGDAVRVAKEAEVKRLILVHRDLNPLTLRSTPIPVVLVHRCDVLDI